MSDLIDTTEMYLRTIYELEEEGVVALRARIAERLHQSGPTVSQTVARMERDGLLKVSGDRHIELSPEGHNRATRVMRKHRLAERLLIDVIGLEWDLVHDEACRWEHVISEHVERRLIELLNAPVSSPYGNPIPGLAELGIYEKVPGFREGTEPLSEVISRIGSGETVVQIARMSEHVQSDSELLTTLHTAGVIPGVKVTVAAEGLGVKLVPAGGAGCELDLDTAGYLFVTPA